jgi:Protein of unknown function (DUF4012)
VNRGRGDPARGAAAPPAGGPKRAGGRRWRLLGGVALLLVLAWACAAGVLVWSARSDLLHARADAERGLGAVLDGDVAPAADALEAARAGFGQARARLSTPFTAPLAVVPVAGPNLRAVRDLATAGEAVADGGARITRTVADMPGGIAALAPSGGALPVAALAEVGVPVSEARVQLAAAAAALERVPASGLVGQVQDARAQLEEQLTPVRRTLDATEPLLRALPALLGGDGPRRYFLGAAQPSELRGSTGFIGAYAVLTLDQGRLGFSPFGAIQDLPTLPAGELEPPNPDFLSRYGAFGGTGVWQNLNVSPDFPTTGRAIERLWERVNGERLDGTITVDPFALQALLALAGPTDVLGYGQVDAGNVVQFVSYDAYGLFSDSEERKRLLGQVAAAALGGFLERGLAQGAEGALTALRTLGDVARAGHIRVHAADPEIQRALDAAGLSGALLDPEGDFFAPFLNGASGTKIDWFLQPALRYTVTPRPDGSARAEAVLTLDNGAPPGEQPGLVTGSNVSRVPPGTNELYVGAYLATSGRLEAFRADDAPAEGAIESELGHPVVTSFETLAPGAVRTLSYRVVTDRAWQTSQGGGRYRLTLQRQPTIRPARLDLEVQAPDGMRVVAAGAPLQVEQDRAWFSGEVPGTVQVDVWFERIVR